MCCDLENVYLNVKCHEKIWFEGSLEHGEDQGKLLIVVRALYGLKSAGTSWQQLELVHLLLDLRYQSKKADPDVFLQNFYRCQFYSSEYCTLPNPNRWKHEGT